MRTLQEVQYVFDRVEVVINEIVNAYKDYRIEDSKNWIYAVAISDALGWVLEVGKQTDNFWSELKLEELRFAALGERSG